MRISCKAAVACVVMGLSSGLAGCGSGGAVDPQPSGEDTLDPDSARDAFLRAGFGPRSISHDAARDVMVVTYGSPNVPNTVTVSHFLAVDRAGPPGFTAYTSPGGDMRIVRGQTASGSGTAFAGAFTGDGVETNHLRLTETVLPASGSARMTGSYMGVISDFATDGYRGYITGEVALFADFDAMTMQGEIGQRFNTNAIPRGFEKLILLVSPIDARRGSFGGPTGGGVLTGLPGFDGAPDRYAGFFTGSDGREAVGSVSVLHERGGVPTFRETGSFIAD